MHTIHKSLALAAAALGLAAGTAQAQFTTTTQLGGTALGSIVTNAPGSYTVEVGGGDIWAGSDTFTFHHAPIYGDFDVKVRVESSEYVNVAWSKSGIMVRETTAQNSRMFFPRVTPTLGANDYKLGYRTDPAVGTSGEHEDGGGVGPAYPNAWLRVQRVGSVLNGFYGTDGANWTLMGSQDTTGWAGGAFGEKLLIGVGGCRHDGNIPTATVEFRDFSDTAPLANVGLTREPVSATVNEGSPVTFTARVNAFYNPAWFNPSPILTWFTNGVAVAGATGLDFTIASAPVGFNGMTVSFSADDDGFGGVTSSNAILTVNGDTLAPSVPGGRAEAGATRTSVTIKYSEAMNPATAGDAFNYVITNSAGAPLNVISATMSGGNSNVVLVVDPFSADTQYYIVINNVTDASISGNALPADTTVGFGLVYVPNFIRLARYNGQFVGQNQVTLPTLPASPNLVELGRTSVEYGPDVADDYTSHMKGWFRAPTTGNYTVRITSDDPGQAWVSTDADPANKTILASVPQWTGFREWQAGAAIFTTGRPMVAGEIYYFETYHSEGGGGDHISLAIIPDGTPAINGDASIIVQAANVVQVSQIGDNNASVSITTPPADTTAQENSTASFSVAATTSNAEGGIVRYQWQKNGVDISGATGTSYATPLLAPGDNGSTYRCIVRVVGAVAYSAHATLTVTADTTPPSVVSVTRVSANQMRVNFSEPINATDLADPFNYTAFGPGIGAISTVTASGTAAAIIEVSGASTLGLYGAIVANVRDISAAENVIGANNTDDFLVGVTAENLQHRYTFNAPAAGDASGQVILDSVGTAHGQIKGSGSSYTGDRMVLNGGGSGTAAYGDLPNGLFSVNSTNNGGTGKLTVEGWVKVTAIQSWGRVFDFGSSDIGGGVFGEVNGPGGAGEGRDYVFFSAMNGTDPNTRQIEFRNEDPAGGGGAGNAYGVANFNTEFHYVVTWDEFTGQFLSYEDGVQRGNFTFLRPMSALNDVNCWLGRSQWGGDNNIQAEYNEFRLYNRVLSQSDAAANAASGPDVLVHNNPGAVTNVAVALTVGTVYTNQTSLASVQVAFANLGAFPVSPAFVAFTSDNGVVASVDANGLVTGLTAGTANIQAAVGSVTGSVAIVVTIDTNPPVLLSYAADSPKNNRVRLVFDQAVGSGALDSFNYTVSGGLTVSSVVADGPNAVIVNTDAGLAEGSYTLTYANVDDLTTPPNLTSGSVNYRNMIIVPNAIRFERFNGLFDINSIKVRAAQGNPDISSYSMPLWEYGPDVADNYGTWISGWIKAPASFPAQVWVSSDDLSQAYASTDSDPANKVLVAYQNAWNGFRGWVQGDGALSVPSGPISVVAGEFYYVETFHQEGGGGDSVSLGVVPFGTPVNNGDNIVVGNDVVWQFAIAGLNGAAVNINTQPITAAGVEGGPVSVTVAASTVNVPSGLLRYQWRKDGVEVSGANSATYTIASALIADSGMYDCIIRTLGDKVTTTTAKLSVTAAIASQTNTIAEGNGVMTLLGGTVNSFGDTLTYVITSPAAYGAANIVGNQLTYTPSDINNFNGLDSVTFDVFDNGINIGSGTATVVVTAVDDLKPYIFAPATSVAGNADPVAIAIGKFNTGLSLDILVANSSLDQLTVIGGNGKGVFGGTNTSTIPVLDEPVAIVVGDFAKGNGSDIAVLHRAGNSILILSNNNLNVFGTYATIPLVAGLPQGIASGFFNSDLNLDLAVVDTAANTLTVYTNNGIGIFAVASTTTVGSGPIALAAGKIDGDTKTDVVVANWSDSTISILYGQGNGAFSNAYVKAVGSNPVAVALAKLNNTDTKLDIAVANYSSDDVSVFVYATGVPSGFGSAANIGVQADTGLEPASLALADFNKDKNLDIVIGLRGDDAVEIMNGTTNGLFTYFWNDPSSHYVVGDAPAAIAVGELNGDLSIDAAVANSGDGTVSLLLNNFTPKAIGASVTVREDETVNIALNGTHGPLDYILDLTGLGMMTNGSLTATNGSMTNTTVQPIVTYAPNANANGKDQFRFYVSDTFKTSKWAVVKIGILAVNDQPTFAITNALVQANEDQKTVKVTNFVSSVVRGPVAGGSTDHKGTVKFALTVGAPEHTNIFNGKPGQPKISGGTNYVLEFTPGKNKFGTTTVSIVMIDANGTANGGTNTSEASTFTIEVAGVNDIPTIKKAYAPLSIDEETSGTVALLVGDVETATGDLVVTVLSTNNAVVDPTNVTVSVVVTTNALGVVTTNRSVAVVPNADGAGKTLLQFTVTDANGGSTNVNVPFSVRGVNDAPSFTLVTNDLMFVAGASKITNSQTIIGSSSSGGGADEASQKLTYEVTNSNPLAFTLTGAPKISTNGVLTFVLNAGAQSATMGVRVKDTGGILYGGVNVSGYQVITISAAPPAP